jgi:N-acetylglutamate synthase-like GNAT family acetyltransferase
MIEIDLLKNHPGCIQRLSEIWYEVLGKVWIPDVPMERVVERFNEHLNEDSLPLTFVAFEEDVPVGMCSLRINDGLKSELTPWMGSLVIDPVYQRRGIAKILMEATKAKAKELGFEKLYLFAFDPTLPNYYTRHGWKTIGRDEFKTLPVTVMEIGL